MSLVPRLCQSITKGTDASKAWPRGVIYFLCLKRDTCTSVQVGAEVANRLLVHRSERAACRVPGGSAIPHVCLLQKAWGWCWKMGFQYLNFSQFLGQCLFLLSGYLSPPMDPFSEPMCLTTLVMKVFRNATREGPGPLSDNHVKS